MINEISQSSTEAVWSTGTNNSMGKEDFLQLLITQMKNQDPMSPLDNSDFAAQLAQFSSLEQLSNLNTSMTQSIDADYYLTQSINNTLTATLIGKDVKLSGENIVNNGGDGLDLGYNLPAEAKSVTVNIYNSQGVLVKTFEDPSISSGDHKLFWDFTDNNGSKLPEGNYKMEIEAKDLSGESMTVDKFIWGTIDGVKFGENGTTLLVNNSQFMLSDILEIINPVQ